MRERKDDLRAYAQAQWNELAGTTPRRSLRELGTVIEVRGDLVEVAFPRGRMCEGCGSCCVAAGEDSMVVEARNPHGAGRGDRVEVEVPLGIALKAAYLLYGVPLLAFLLGLGAGGALGALVLGGSWGVPLGLGFGFGFLALSYLFLSRVYSTRSRAGEAYRPVIIRVVERAAEARPPLSPEPGTSGDQKIPSGREDEPATFTGRGGLLSGDHPHGQGHGQGAIHR
ncbi:MAG: SoxR reducing system RseC family protein [Actinomycetota bacterium]